MKVLIIGGTRYFGKRLARNLITAGHEVSVLSRGQTKFELQGPHEHIICDRTLGEEMKQALEGKKFDVVVDQVCMNQEQAQSAMFALTGKTDHYVLTSTLSVYEPGADLKEADLDPLSYEPSVPTNAYEEYCFGKRGAEHALYSQAPFKVAIARFPIVLGEDDYTKRLDFIVDAIKKKRPVYFEKPAAKFSFIHSEDAARVLQCMVQNKLQGVYNLASPTAWEMKQVLDLISELVGERYLLSSDQKDETPLSITDDYYLNCEKAVKAGFELRETSEWLPQLIRYQLGT